LVKPLVNKLDELRHNGITHLNGQSLREIAEILSGFKFIINFKLQPKYNIQTKQYRINTRK